jgi:hypothetical protein
MIKHIFFVLLATMTLAGCGHSKIAYTPVAPQGISIKQAASIVEQGFYEDYSQEKPQTAMVTEEFIGLSNGTITRGLTTGTAQIFGGVAVGLGSTFLRTEEINQRIYFRSLGTPIVSKRNGRENRYAVTIRLAEGVTARNVYFRSEQRAREFADALAYLRDSSARGALGSTPAAASGMPSEKTYKAEQLEDLRRQNLPYEEYQKRYRQITGE